MVDDESAEGAYAALKMVIAGLAEDVLELAAARPPTTARERIAEMSQMAQAGRDLALAANAAGMALARAYSLAMTSESLQKPL